VYNIVIRQAAESDLADLTEIVKKYRDFQGIESQDVQQIEAFLRERITKSESVILVAVHEETSAIAGFVQLYPTFSTVSLQRQWLLNDLFVAEEERGQGIGSALMEAVKEHFRGKAKGFILVTEKTNAGAKRFYDRHGWKTDHFDFYCYFY
jgi:GNAT superfamily N-acetyltransferase